MLKIKTLNLFLTDGSPFGRIKYTYSFLNYVAHKIPRDKIEFLAEQNGGLCFFFSDTSVRIGAPENFETENWNEALFFSAAENALDSTALRFLENKFRSLAQAAGRYEITGSENSTPPNISEEKESELDFFVEFVSVVTGILGYKIFEPVAEIPAPPAENPDNDTLFYLTRNSRNVAAKCHRVGSKFIVMAGSQISEKVSKSVSENVKKARKKAKLDKNNALLEDLVFNSPSAAADFVLGTSTNGWTEWKTKDGVPLSNFR